MTRRLLAFLLFFATFFAHPARALAADAADVPAPSPQASTAAPAPTPCETPTLLLAAVERAWKTGDANALASLCDSARVRIALKPGAPPAAAPTLSAAAFLIRDQWALVVSQGFQITRLETNAKARTARAWARWRGMLNGARVARDIEVVLAARAVGDGTWLLTEIRAND